MSGQDWRAIHDLLVAWMDDDDTAAGARILRYLAEGVIITRPKPNGVLLCPGPRWEQRVEADRG